MKKIIILLSLISFNAIGAGTSSSTENSTESSDQITMLMEGNVCDSEEIFSTLEIKPIPFNSESLSYLKD